MVNGELYVFKCVRCAFKINKQSNKQKLSKQTVRLDRFAIDTLRVQLRWSDFVCFVLCFFLFTFVCLVQSRAQRDSAILSNSHKCSFNDRIKNASLCEKYLHTNIFLQRCSIFSNKQTFTSNCERQNHWHEIVMHNDFFRSVSSKTSSHRAVFRESCYNMITMRKSRVMLYITLWKGQIIWFYMICCDSRI